MIALCAHHDTVRPGYFPSLFHGNFTGLLDNALGMFAAEAVIFRNHSLLQLASSGQLAVYHADDEEFLLPLPLDHLLARPDLALVIDVVSGKKYQGLDAAIENVWMPTETASALPDLTSFLEAEGYKVAVKPFSGDEMDEDEAWMWKEVEIPTMSILLPIDPPPWHTETDGFSWHLTDCTCPIERFNTFLDVITRVICLYMDTYGSARKETPATLAS